MKLIHNLRSIRKFAEKEISKVDIEIILEASIRAANSGARQVYSIIVVDEKDLLKKYFYNANKALVFLIDFNRWADLANRLGHTISSDDIRGFTISSMDAVLAAQTAVIAAKSIGIDSLITTSLHRANLKEVYENLNLPDYYCFPFLSVCLGYSEQKPIVLKGRVRKGVIHYGKYHRMTPDELDEQIVDYDTDKKHLGFVKKEEWAKNYSHYLDLYFSKWASRSPDREINGFLNMMRKTGFLPEE